MKLLKYITLFLVMISFVGCNDYLQSVPYSFTTIDNFYKSEEDAEIALAGCYSILIARTVQNEGVYSTFAAGQQFMFDAGTDELVPSSNLSSRTELVNFGYLSYSPEEELLRKNWFFWFSGVNRANYLIENIKNIEMSESKRNEINGEAHFLRGLFYMYLAQTYGGVPLFKTPDVNPLAPRNSIQDVFNLVIDDFEFAYNTLSDRSSVKGRANKWSAAGFLAKTYCYLASCKINNVGADLNFELNSFDWVDESDFYSKAVTLTSNIIANSNYELVNDYGQMFYEMSKEIQDVESLFSIRSSDDVIIGVFNLYLRYYQLPQGNTSRFGGGSAFLRPAGEMYLEKYVDGDSRRDHNLVAPINAKSLIEQVDGYNYYEPVISNPNRVKAGVYSCGKFRMIEPSSKTVPIDISVGNYPLLRLADVMLLNAEANYAVGNEAAARSIMTELRTRALDGTKDISFINSAYTKDNFDEELLDERSRELCFEAQRRIDLIRFNKYSEVLAGLNSDKSYARWNESIEEMRSNWHSFRIWFPIPSSQIALNSNLIQNPGY